MKTFIAILFFSSILHAEVFTASNKAKAYLGGDGERINTVEVNGSKKIIVTVLGVGGAWEGRTFVWDLRESKDTKEAYFEQKRGSKSWQHITMAFQNNKWTIFPEDKPGKSVDLNYSQKESETLHAEELIKLANKK